MTDHVEGQKGGVRRRGGAEGVELQVSRRHEGALSIKLEAVHPPRAISAPSWLKKR